MSLAQYPPGYEPPPIRITLLRRQWRIWNYPETVKLRALAEAGWPAHEIAEALGRSNSAVRCHASKEKIRLIELVDLPSSPVPSREEAAVLYRIESTQSMVGELRAVIEVTARRHGLRYADLVGLGRDFVTARVRQEAMWLCCRDTKKSLPIIGRAFKRHHTTVLHGVRAENGRRGENIRDFGGPK